MSQQEPTNGAPHPLINLPPEDKRQILERARQEAENQIRVAILMYFLVHGKDLADLRRIVEDEIAENVKDSTGEGMRVEKPAALEQTPAPPELVEALADYAHTAWAGWMEYLFGKATRHSDGSYTIPPDLAQRWRRQLRTPYHRLPDNEQESDRKEARAILAIIADHERAEAHEHE